SSVGRRAGRIAVRRAGVAGRTATRLPERRGVMTTADRNHLKWPDTARLKQRLADAEAQHLILFDYKENPIDPFSFEARAKCTPSEKMEPYHVFMRWDMTELRVYLHCKIGRAHV